MAAKEGGGERERGEKKKGSSLGILMQGHTLISGCVCTAVKGGEKKEKKKGKSKPIGSRKCVYYVIVAHLQVVIMADHK